MIKQGESNMFEARQWARLIIPCLPVLLMNIPLFIGTLSLSTFFPIPLITFYPDDIDSPVPPTKVGSDPTSLIIAPTSRGLEEKIR